MKVQYQKANLLMHCGAQAIDLSNLRKMPTPSGQTSTHVTVPHAEVYDMVSESLTAAGLSIVQSVHAVGECDGIPNALYFAMMQVVNGKASSEFATVIGLRSSHNRRLPIGVAAGSQVFVCDNLAFSGEVKAARKHTRNVRRDLPRLIDNAIEKILRVNGCQIDRLASYHEHEIDKRDVDYLLMECYRKGVYSAAKIGRVHDEFWNPSFDYDNADSVGSTVWGFQNAVTHVMKPREKGQDIFTLAPKTVKMHQVFDNFVQQ